VLDMREISPRDGRMTCLKEGIVKQRETANAAAAVTAQKRDPVRKPLALTDADGLTR
jgi:hypothetical protein